MFRRMHSILLLAFLGMSLLAASSALAQTVYTRVVRPISISTTLDDTHDIVLATAGTGITITLPSVATNTGRHYTIKKVDDAAGAVTIQRNLADIGATIDGQPSYTLAKQYQEVRVVSDGTRWRILDALSKATLDATTFPGANIGAQANAAIAALPSAGGRVDLGCGTLSFNTQIRVPTGVTLQGCGDSLLGATAPTRLIWTGGALSPILSTFALSAGNAVRDGTTHIVTVTTTSDPQFGTGDWVEMVCEEQADWVLMGTYKVTRVDANNYTYTQPAGGAYTNAGTCKAQKWGNGITSAVRASNITTITTPQPHGLSPNEWAHVSGLVALSDLKPFNGAFQVLDTPTPTTFRYNNPGQSGSTTIGTNPYVTRYGGAIFVDGSGTFIPSGHTTADNFLTLFKNFTVTNTGSGAVGIHIPGAVNGPVYLEHASVAPNSTATPAETGFSLAGVLIGHLAENAASVKGDPLAGLGEGFYCLNSSVSMNKGAGIYFLAGSPFILNGCSLQDNGLDGTASKHLRADVILGTATSAMTQFKSFGSRTEVSTTGSSGIPRIIVNNAYALSLDGHICEADGANGTCMAVRNVGPTTSTASVISWHGGYAQGGAAKGVSSPSQSAILVNNPNADLDVTGTHFEGWGSAALVGAMVNNISSRRVSLLNNQLDQVSGSPPPLEVAGVTTNVNRSGNVVVKVNSTFSIQPAQLSQSLTLSALTNQMVMGSTPNQTTVNFPAPSGAVTLMAQNTTSTIPGRLFAGTANQVQTGIVTAASIVPTGTGSLSLPANFWIVGRTVEIELQGFYSSGADPGTQQLLLKLGTVTIGDSGAINMAANQTIQLAIIRLLITCRTTGATGTLFTQGYSQGSGCSGPSCWASAISPFGLAGSQGLASTGTTTVDTTAAAALDLQITYSAAGNTWTTTNMVVKSN